MERRIIEYFSVFLEMPTCLFHDLLPDVSSKLVRWLARVTDAVAIQDLKGLSMRPMMLGGRCFTSRIALIPSPNMFALHVTITADLESIGPLWQTTHSQKEASQAKPS